MTYEEALAYITGLEPRGWRLGLDRMREFVHRAGLDSAVDGSRRSYIHVAGTNGKGSVTAYLQSLLVAGGHRTGAFFSPFVVDPRERVQLDRELIGKEVLAELTAELRVVAEGMEGTPFSGVTEFEFKTALGFLAWERANCEWVALETGLGGRLDATNVVTPAGSVIVSIGLDHQAILGETKEKIAFEKAGIMKPGRPVVVGAMPEGPANVIRDVAAGQGSPVWAYGKEIFWEPEGGVIRTPLRQIEGVRPAFIGEWQGHNAALAVAATDVVGLELSEAQVREGLAAAYAPGRFERLEFEGHHVILDGAHNHDSAVALANTLEAQGIRRVRLVTNMLHGHEPSDFYGPLQSAVEEAIVPPIQFHRARTTEDMSGHLNAMGISARTVTSVEAALAEAAQAHDGVPILVTGSFYLVGEALHLLRNG